MSLPERIRDYLNERLKDESYNLFRPEKPYEVISHPNAKWCVQSRGCGIISYAEERGDGTIWIMSKEVDRPGDLVDEYLTHYRFRRRLDRAKSKEEKRRAFEEMGKEELKIYEDFINRRNLEKHLRIFIHHYNEPFIRLLWFDEVAKEASEKYGAKVEVFIDEMYSGWEIAMVSKFDGSNMDDEKKFKEIKKGIKAVIVARKMAQHAYKPFPGHSPELREKYSEFRRALLRKYLPRRKMDGKSNA